MMDRVLAVILAGGRGSRLEPLTRDRAKPAVPFGGAYRIIDFTLSNCLNSGLRQILVLTQYKAMSLDRHINRGWRGYFCRERVSSGNHPATTANRRALVSGDRRCRLSEHLRHREGTAPVGSDPCRRPHLQDELSTVRRVPHRETSGLNDWRLARDARGSRSAVRRAGS